MYWYSLFFYDYVECFNYVYWYSYGVCFWSVCVCEWGGGLCFALQLAIQPLFKLVSFAFSALIALTRWISTTICSESMSSDKSFALLRLKIHYVKARWSRVTHIPRGVSTVDPESVNRSRQYLLPFSYYLHIKLTINWIDCMKFKNDRIWWTGPFEIMNGNVGFNFNCLSSSSC